MIDTVALDPAYSPLGEPVTAMVTGKEATLALLEAAISPIDDTVPYTGVLDPLGVMTAWSPAWIWPTSVSSTVVLTVKAPVDTTTMSLLLPEDDDELEVDDDEPRALAAAPRPLSPEDVEELDPVPPEPDAPDPELPETSSPVVRLTDATVPLKVEVRLASARLVWAVDSCEVAAVTAA